MELPSSYRELVVGAMPPELLQVERVVANVRRISIDSRCCGAARARLRADGDPFYCRVS